MRLRQNRNASPLFNMGLEKYVRVREGERWRERGWKREKKRMRERVRERKNGRETDRQLIAGETDADTDKP